MDKNDQLISVYPNPITTNQFTLQIQGLAKGDYAIVVYNKSGQQVYNKSFSTNGGTIMQMVEMNAPLQGGVYTAVVTGKDGIVSRQQISKH
jgi:hypothetical protein